MQGEEYLAFVPLLEGEHPNDVIDSVYGLTRMHVAARDGNVAYLTYLLENGGDVNVKSSGGRGLSGETPLHWAKTSETVAVLIEHGADRDAPAAIGQHALHSLASRNRQDSVAALIRAGANVNSTDSYLGWNAVGWACCGLATDRAHDDVEIRLRERQSLIRYLVRQGSDVNHRNNDGETVVHLVVKAVELDVLRLLIELGADPSIANTDGIRPIDIARSNGLTDIATLLQE